MQVVICKAIRHYYLRTTTFLDVHLKQFTNLKIIFVIIVHRIMVDPESESSYNYNPLVYK